MLRRRGGFALRTAGAGQTDEEVNPLDTVANLSDVMLVLAVALMLVIVMHWKVDLTGTQEDQPENMEPIEESSANSQALDQSGEYEEIGKVYRDVNTGDLYIVKDEE